MSRLPLILLERTGRWGVALRRELDEQAVRLVETRSLEECWLRLAAYPDALLALELTEANLRPLVGTLIRLQRQFPAAAALVLADRRLAAAEPLLREAGAIHFVTSPRALGAVREIVRRRLDANSATFAGITPCSPTVGWEDLLDEIAAGLPWAENS